MNAVASFQKTLDGLNRGDDWGVEAAAAILAEGIRLGLSDLHLLPRRERMDVLGRREDEMIHIASVPQGLQDLLVARIKVLARVPAFVREEPQDGRLEWRGSPQSPPVFLRVAFLPTLHGEAVTIRLPENVTETMTLDELGMSNRVRDAVLRLLNRREGVLFTTGPSGSGKTTTLYALLRYLNEQRGDRLSFFTIEDPVEKELPFAAQVQVRAQQGFGFDRALRATLRQSPNVLLIGEVRDRETAAIAMQAGMTGHLVLSTLHAGRAVQVPTRLLSLNVEPYLVASALAGSMAQRLVRLREQEGERPRRLGLFELLPLNEGLRSLVLGKATVEEFATHAEMAQVENLMETARRLRDEGVLSDEELHLSLGEDFA